MGRAGAGLRQIVREMDQAAQDLLNDSDVEYGWFVGMGDAPS